MLFKSIAHTQREFLPTGVSLGRRLGSLPIDLFGLWNSSEDRDPVCGKVFARSYSEGLAGGVDVGMGMSRKRRPAPPALFALGGRLMVGGKESVQRNPLRVDGDKLIVYNFSTDTPSASANEAYKFRDSVEDLGLLAHFPAVYNEVVDFLGAGPNCKVLSHCTAGRSRSVAMAVMLLCKAHFDQRIDALFPGNERVSGILNTLDKNAFEKVMLVLDYFREVQRATGFREEALVSPNTGNLLRLAVAIHYMGAGGVVSEADFGLLKEACLAYVQSNVPKGWQSPKDPWCEGITGYDPVGLARLRALELAPMLERLRLFPV